MPEEDEQDNGEGDRDMTPEEAMVRYAIGMVLCVVIVVAVILLEHWWGGK